VVIFYDWFFAAAICSTMRGRTSPTGPVDPIRRTKVVNLEIRRYKWIRPITLDEDLYSSQRGMIIDIDFNYLAPLGCHFWE